MKAEYSSAGYEGDVLVEEAAEYAPQCKGITRGEKKKKKKKNRQKTKQINMLVRRDFYLQGITCYILPARIIL